VSDAARRFATPQQLDEVRAAARRMRAAALVALVAAVLTLLVAAAWSAAGASAQVTGAAGVGGLLLAALGLSRGQGSAAIAASLGGGDDARAHVMKALSRLRTALILKALLVLPTTYLITAALGGVLNPEGVGGAWEITALAGGALAVVGVVVSLKVYEFLAGR